MTKFNLIDEPWISVIVDDSGERKDVSLRELFQNAKNYKDFGGDTKTQDFAVMRVVLSIIHTVFSRYDHTGNAYSYFEIDEKFRQTKFKNNYSYADYTVELESTWGHIWEEGIFPSILFEYLEKWHDRFYLFDEKYPFYQVTKDDIAPDKISKNKASIVSGKNINRLISESGNKIALFSPKSSEKNNKEILTEAEVARWLITFQGYTGLADKVIFGKDKYKASKGWLFDIGGVYLKGNNLFETLMVNSVLNHIDEDNNAFQNPCWEFSGEEVISQYFDSNIVDNIARLYTLWSRAIYINPDIDLSKGFECEIVKLPDVNHQNSFIEPMTLWRHNQNGENKNTQTPRKHVANVSLWRNFGLLIGTLVDESKKYPEIIKWKNDICTEYNIENIAICAVSMQDDGNATSWVPTDEILDSLLIDDYVLASTDEDEESTNWVTIITEIVEDTQRMVGFYYKQFLMDVAEIRGIDKEKFYNKKLEEMYAIIDQPFRYWLASIQPDSDNYEKEAEWTDELHSLILEEADKIIEQRNPKDYVGKEQDKSVKNIFTAYNILRRRLKFKK